MVTGIGIFGGLGLFFWWLGLERSDQMASVAGLFLNFIAVGLAAFTVVEARRGRRPGQDQPDDVYLERLAEALQRSYARESAARRLQDPDPLPTRWAAPEPDLMDHPRNIWPDGLMPAALLGSRTLLDAFLRVPTGRLALLGGAGSGKTVAALGFALDFLSVRLAGEKVPVILPLSSWDQARLDFHSWVAARIIETDSHMAQSDAAGVTWAQRAVDRRLVLPILDGLDELPAGVKSGVLHTLNAVLEPDDQVLITCRDEQYRVAVDGGDVLTAAAVLRLEPLDFDAVAQYLPRTTRPERHPAGETKWDPVLAQLRDHPAAAVHASVLDVLSTPLMVWLARVRYSDTRADPLELLEPRFADRQTLREFLLDGMIPALYADPAGSGRAAGRGADAERWLTRIAVDLSWRHGPNLRWWRMADDLPLHTMRTVVSSGAAGLSAAVVAVILGLRIDLGPALLFAAGFGGVVGVAVWLLPWLRGPAEPTIIGNTVPLQLRQIGAYAGTGLATVALMLVSAVTESRLGQWIPPMGMGGAALWSLLGLLPLLLIAIVSLLARPVEADDAVSPLDLIRADRLSALTQGSLIGLGAMLLVTTASVSALSLRGALLLGAGFGAVAGTVWAIAGSAWGRFLLLRLYYGTVRRYPFRLVGFLDDAHRRGVLRQVGATYQFRHELLQSRLLARSRLVPHIVDHGPAGRWDPGRT
jgi:hypothetical protein